MQVTHNIVGSLPAVNYHRDGTASQEQPSTYSNPKRISRSRRLTTITCTFRLRKIRHRAWQRPFQPEPVSCTASSTRKPCLAENSVKPDRGRSKSTFWPREETLAYKATTEGSFWRGVENHRARGQLLGGHRQLASLPQPPRGLSLRKSHVTLRLENRPKKGRRPGLVGQSLLPGLGAQFHVAILP
jgi:hypothetical protein